MKHTQQEIKTVYMALYNGWCFTERKTNFKKACGKVLPVKQMKLNYQKVKDILEYLRENNMVFCEYWTKDGVTPFSEDEIESQMKRFEVSHHRLCVTLGNRRKVKKPNIKKIWQLIHTWDYDTEIDAENRIENFLLSS